MSRIAGAQFFIACLLLGLGSVAGCGADLPGGGSGQAVQLSTGTPAVEQAEPSTTEAPQDPRSADEDIGDTEPAPEGLGNRFVWCADTQAVWTAHEEAVAALVAARGTADAAEAELDIAEISVSALSTAERYLAVSGIVIEAQVEGQAALDTNDARKAEAAFMAAEAASRAAAAYSFLDNAEQTAAIAARAAFRQLAYSLHSSVGGDTDSKSVAYARAWQDYRSALDADEAAAWEAAANYIEEFAPLWGAPDGSNVEGVEPPGLTAWMIASNRARSFDYDTDNFAEVISESYESANAIHPNERAEQAHTRLINAYHSVTYFPTLDDATLAKYEALYEDFVAAADAAFEEAYNSYRAQLDDAEMAWQAAESQWRENDDAYRAFKESFIESCGL